MEGKLTECIILGLLSERYCMPQWLFVPHFEDRKGSRWFDGFATNFDDSPHRVGFEVKVSRGDFMSELRTPEKRQRIEELCHECFFVCPSKMVRVGEIPERWGLIEVSPAGVLRTVKAAQFVNVKAAPLWVWQSLVRGDRREDRKFFGRFDKLKVFRLALREEPLSEQDLYDLFLRYEQQLIGRRAEQLASERERSVVEEEGRMFQRLSEVLGEQVYNETSLVRAVKELKTGIPNDLLRAIRGMIVSAQNAERALKRVGEGPKSEEPKWKLPV